MHGDFSRLTFDKRNHYSRVLVQQGRVYLDAEPNEQTSILLHLIRGMMRDLLGPHGAPSEAEQPNGFRIETGTDFAKSGFAIAAGHYYVDGILCENDEDTHYFGQPDLPISATIPGNALPSGSYLVYLDVWERHLTFLDQALLRETALGGVDTASRAQVVWQVKAQELKPWPATAPTGQDIATWVQGREPAERPAMRARAGTEEAEKKPCLDAPTDGYRGAENQLYRIEVHQGGSLDAGPKPTLKWSRDNGSIVFPITTVQERGVVVPHLGPDPTRSLEAGDWVEVLDDVRILLGKPGIMARVTEVIESQQIGLARADDKPMNDESDGVDQAKHPFLRRWDHRAEPTAGTIEVIESDNLETGWIPIEDGIEIQFQPKAVPPSAPKTRQYRTGDFWLVAARVATTGHIEWPETTTAGTTTPDWLSPTGVEHHYAPLAKMTGNSVDERFRLMFDLTASKET
jgi:uncharacterized protein DUF6519